jgi:arylsulfatase A-like enzyme
MFEIPLLLRATLLAALLALGCAPHTGGDTDTDTDTDTEATPSDEPPNLLVVILDDVGIEAIEPWATLVEAPGEVVPTPTLDSLAEAGLSFRTAWATPTCSPTRMGLHTGLYPSHGGVLAPVERDEVLFTPTSQTLPRLLEERYRTGLFGKWHLGGGASAPVIRGGWQAYAGGHEGGVGDYYAWERTEVDSEGEAVTATSTVYATTAVVDDALDWLVSEEDERPWLVMLSFNASHSPFHLPPAALRPDFTDTTLDADEDGLCDEDGPCHRAAVQALDTELGRFIDSLSTVDGSRDTVIIALGDNGTPGTVIQEPFTQHRAKGTLYEGGIRVPLWISGPSSRIPSRGVAEGMVHAATDVFATLLDLAGEPLPQGIDGVSLAPLFQDHTGRVRDTVYTDAAIGETDALIEGAVLRDNTHKVHWFDVTNPDGYGCFDLENAPQERRDLMTEASSPPAICAELFATLLSTR